MNIWDLNTQFITIVLALVSLASGIITILSFLETHRHPKIKQRPITVSLIVLSSIFVLSLILTPVAYFAGKASTSGRSSTTNNQTPTTLSSPTATLVPTPTTIPTTPTLSTSSPSASQSPRVYDFEDGLQSWEFVSTQPSDKPSHLQPTTGLGYNSHGSLELNTNLWGTGNATIPRAGDDNYSHTAIRVFFHNQNYLGKKVSCQLYIPDPVPTGFYFRLFVISDKQDTDSYEYGKNKLHTGELAANTWTELSMVIGDPQNEDDAQFDPRNVNYIGLTVQADGGADMGETSVKVFVDNCTVA